MSVARQPWAWPGEALAAVAITFDLDADAGARWRGVEHRLTTLSEDRYGAVRGLRRILELLARHEVSATFYVPGEIAERWPREVLAVAEAGHEIAHHGYEHLLSDRVSIPQQQAEIERGMSALERVLGTRPVGYRNPGWELTTDSLEMALDAGFLYDSSLMGDDRPYLQRHGQRSILELPVHWSLDDWPYFGFSRDAGGHLCHPDVPLAVWLEEWESAREDRRLVTYVFHPEISGRGYRARVLDRLIGRIRERGGSWFATHREIAEHIGPALRADAGD